MGSSSAYFLANRMAPHMGRICVIEQDPTVREKFLLVILFVCFLAFKIYTSDLTYSEKQNALIPGGPRVDLGDC